MHRCAYHTRNSSRLLPLGPIGREYVEVHGRAEAGDMDLRGRYSRVMELAARDVRQVQIETPLTRFKPSVDQHPRMPCREERFGQFGADFVTADADVRTDGHMKVRRLGPEFTRHRLETRAYRTGRQPAPPRMDGRDRSRLRIGDEQRDTVRRPDRDCDLRVVRDDDIRGSPGHDRLRRFAPDHDDLAPVHLVRRDHSTRRTDDGRNRLPAILRQLKLTRGEEMRGNVLEGSAPEQGSMRGPRPRKGFGNSGQCHTLIGTRGGLVILIQSVASCRCRCW